MRIFGLFLLVAAMAFGMSSPSFAKKGSWSWWPNHWQEMDFTPYVGGQKLHQRWVWDSDPWTPQDWIDQAGDEKRVLHDFYAAGILTDQYTDSDDIPVLEVGDGFIKLSGKARRRVLGFVDYVFEITKSEEFGTFYVYYQKDDEKPMGLYNKHGFQSY